jgi:hypothetical protein
MLCLSDHLHRVLLREEPHLSLPEAVRQKLATVLAGQEVMQQQMRRAVAELSIGYRDSPIVAEHQRLLSGPRRRWPAHASSRTRTRSVLPRLRGTMHHLVLFAGAHATGETHRRLQALADSTIHAYPDRIEPHLVVSHELPEDRVGKGELLLDPRGELHHSYGARSACLYVVRPDGYIGFRSQPPDSEALRSYFTKIFL